MTRLEKALSEKESFFDGSGIAVTYDDSRLPSSCSASLDSGNYVGTITHWPGCRFEFQFNNARSGDVVLLETKDFDATDDLAAFIEEIFRTILK